jgi:hypothetical protein
MSGDHDRIPEIDYTTHHCPDWDGLLINCEDPEFKCCTCPQYTGKSEGGLRFTQNETNELIEALEEAVYLLNPTQEDMQKKAGVYRVVTALEKLKEKNA